MGLTGASRVGSLAPTRYQTQWRPAGADWQAGPVLELGFSWDAQHMIQPSVVLADVVCDLQSSLSVDADRALVLSINRSVEASLICSFDTTAFIRCSAVLSLDGTAFTGKVTQLCDGLTVDLPWKGQCLPTF